MKLSDFTALPEFRFKGERTYIHGTDLFQTVSEFMESRKAGYLRDMSFRSFGDKQCAIQFSPPGTSNAQVISQGRWHDTENDSDVKFWVTEQGDSVSDRYEFDEDTLCDGAQIGEEKITRQFNSAFSMIENLVALTKKFHNTQLPLASGKWVFGQIMLQERLPERCKSIQIENYQNITNRFSRNRIILDDKHVGEIRFIVA
ncbi:hypothetical protein [Marinobacter shengliensis]|uniref:hypothetical protein n=1 Tax=Marinobacter shengliensis TaxID=1389223 RepID=UPI000D10295A|nr:hypothetical protein [Marinobacter shengliensis]PSF12973.1 hypothetical protein C7H10_12345 [Marinobacter shengliensis]